MENKRVRKVVANVKGVEIEFDEYYLIDSETNEEIFDRNIEIENDKRLYDIYKKRMGLLTSNEIKEARTKYKMNQKEFALAIGLGEITIHRLENGSIQTEAVDTVIRLSEDPDIMYKFIVRNKSNFTETEYKIFLDTISSLIKLKEHKIAQLNIDEFSSLYFKTEDAYTVANQLIINYNKRVDNLSSKYGIKDMCETAEYITPLKLQKLLYYIQGLSATVYGMPAFNNNIYAWSYGPVVDDVYQKYNGRNSIATPKEDFKISKGLEKIIDVVISSYGQFEAEQLIDLTHGETPWIKTSRNKIIKFELIKDYFTKVYDN